MAEGPRRCQARLYATQCERAEGHEDEHQVHAAEHLYTWATDGQGALVQLNAINIHGVQKMELTK